LLQRLAREVASLEQRKRQVFAEARVAGYGNQNLRIGMMDQLIERRIGRESGIHRLPRCAAISSAPSTGRTTAKLSAAPGCSARMASLNAWRTIADPCRTPPESASGTTPPLGQSLTITAPPRAASALPARVVMSRAVESPLSAASVTTAA